VASGDYLSKGPLTWAKAHAILNGRIRRGLLHQLAQPYLAGALNSAYHVCMATQSGCENRSTKGWGTTDVTMNVEKLGSCRVRVCLRQLELRLLLVELQARLDAVECELATARSAGILARVRPAASAFTK
jgi:hypothetical protein